MSRIDCPDHGHTCNLEGPEPERDVLERLRRLLKRYGPLAPSEFSLVVADAIAEISKLRDLREAHRQETLTDAYRRSQYTEAEPVESDVWMRLRVEGGVTREIRADGSKGWTYEHEFGLPPGDFVISRALIVAPKGDTEST